VRAEREDGFEAQPELDPDMLVFLDETAAATNMVRRYGRAARGERCGVAVPQGMCGRPLGCKQNLGTGVVRDRVLPCLRPLMRRSMCRGPVWECESRNRITTARSKRFP
jgi:hypothetical protein